MLLELTNAILFICDFHPAAIDRRTGLLPEDAVFTPVPIVRFSKNLSTMPVRSYAGLTLDASHMANDRTVFVVNVEALPAFLAQFRITYPPRGLQLLLNQQ